MRVNKLDRGWLVREEGFNRNRTEILGSKLLIANGYMGYRGTLEEYSHTQLVACTLSGFYDRHKDAWREPVNAPNGLMVKLYCQGRLLSPLQQKPLKHSQVLDIRHGIHTRETVYALPKGGSCALRRSVSRAWPILIY